MMTNGDFYSDLMVINVDLMMIFFLYWCRSDLMVINGYLDLVKTGHF